MAGILGIESRDTFTIHDGKLRLVNELSGMSLYSPIKTLLFCMNTSIHPIINHLSLPADSGMTSTVPIRVPNPKSLVNLSLLHRYRLPEQPPIADF